MALCRQAEQLTASAREFNPHNKNRHASPGVLEGLQEEPLQHVEVRRQHVTHRLRQLVQHNERELAVVLRLGVLRALSHQVQELLHEQMP